MKLYAVISPLCMLFSQGIMPAQAQQLAGGKVQVDSVLARNNGEPIPADVAREIFIPFFTTKSSGTGIGLSLSRQMLMMQNIELGLSDNSLSGYHVTFYLEKQDTIKTTK